MSEVIGDGGEANLQRGFRKPAPSHASQPIATFQVPKIFSMRPRTRWTPWFQRRSFCSVSSPGMPHMAVLTMRGVPPRARTAEPNTSPR